MSENLTDKQEMFCLEYLKDFNNTQAAIRAGYSKSTASAQGSRLLRNVKVQKRLTELKTKRMERVGIEADRVLEEIERLAFADVTDVINVIEKEYDIKDADGNLTGEKGTFKTIEVNSTQELPKRVTAAISEIGMTKDGIKIKMHNKSDNLDKLMKHLGLYEKDNDQKKTSVKIYLPEEDD